MHSIFLKYFDEVARQGSIRKAAQQLNISSTSVNRKILSVEKQLGVKLFERHASGIAVTAVGALLLEHCRKTLLDFDRTKLTIDDMRDLRTGHLNLATVDSIALSILPETLDNFSRKYPDISITVMTAQPEEAIEAVAGGSVEVGIGFGYQNNSDVRLIFEKIAPLGVLLRPDHPLAERKSLCLEDLLSYRIVRTIDALGRRSIIDQVFTDINTRLTSFFYTNSLNLAKDMVAENRGIGIYTKIGFYNEVEAGVLRFIPLMDNGIRDLRIGIFTSAKAGMDPVKQFLCTSLSNGLNELRLDG